MSNSKEVEELLLKGLATGHVWKVYRNRSGPWGGYGWGTRTTWRRCLRCGETTDSYWTKANARYYDELLPCRMTKR